MIQFSEVFKARAVQKMVGPGAVSANRLSKDVGVAQATLSRWLREARSVDGMTKPSKQSNQKWTGAEKLRVVRESHGLSETELGGVAQA